MLLLETALSHHLIRDSAKTQDYSLITKLKSVNRIKRKKILKNQEVIKFPRQPNRS